MRWFGRSRKRTFIEALEPVEARRTVVQKTISAYTGKSRQEQLDEIAATQEPVEISPEEQQANRSIAIGRHRHRPNHLHERQSRPTA